MRETAAIAADNSGSNSGNSRSDEEKHLDDDFGSLLADCEDSHLPSAGAPIDNKPTLEEPLHQFGVHARTRCENSIIERPLRRDL